MNHSVLKILLLADCITVAALDCMAQITDSMVKQGTAVTITDKVIDDEDSLMKVDDIDNDFLKQILESSLIGFTSVKVYQYDSRNPVLLQNSSAAEFGYIDMGLSVKWAICNLGASKPEEYGNRYSWGETDTKAYYSWDTYRLCNYDSVRQYLFISKYIPDNVFGGDKRTQLEPEDDVANIMLGENWRMPTRNEFEELQDTCNCIWRWTDDYDGTGVSGCVVTSKMPGYEGNCIFLPAAGVNHMGILSDSGTKGCYWSSSVGLRSESDACSMNINSDYCIIVDRARFFGYSIRPVCK